MQAAPDDTLPLRRHDPEVMASSYFGSSQGAATQV